MILRWLVLDSTGKRRPGPHLIKPSSRSNCPNRTCQFPLSGRKSGGCPGTTPFPRGLADLPATNRELRIEIALRQPHDAVSGRKRGPAERGSFFPEWISPSLREESPFPVEDRFLQAPRPDFSAECRCCHRHNPHSAPKRGVVLGSALDFMPIGGPAAGGSPASRREAGARLREVAFLPFSRSGGAGSGFSAGNEGPAQAAARISCRDTVVPPALPPFRTE